MNQRLVRRILCLCVVAAFGGGAEACSTFCLVGGGQVVVGNSYDWMLGDALVLINKRGVSKVALASNSPARWTSKYGSVTFNQYGREFPSGGMNEAGLVVAQMWLSEAQYPRQDQRSAVGTLQWLQYQLDTAGTVDEAIANLERIRVSPLVNATLHYYVVDRSGKCEVVEYLRGETKCYTGEALPVPVLTNTSYEESVAYLNEHRGFGGRSPVTCERGSRNRFVCAASRVRKYDPKRHGPAVEYAFKSLRRVKQQNTKWNIVYEPTASRISFRTNAARDARTIDLQRLDFSCETPVRMLEINAKLSGDVTGEFQDYSAERNSELIREIYTNTPPLKEMLEMIMEEVVLYPEGTECKAEGKEETAD